MEEQRFASGLQKLQRLLRESSSDLDTPVLFALIGGLAVSAWGAVRATQDIDLLADCTPSPIVDRSVRRTLGDFFASRGWQAEWHSGGMDDPVPLLLRLGLPGNEQGLVADIIWAHKRWQTEALERVIELDVSGMEVIIIHPEDLVLLKLDAGGPRDLMDIEALLSNPPSEMDLVRLKEKAKRLRRGRLLNECLKRAGK